MASVRESISEAIKYWEPRRLIYNGVLSLVVIAHFLLKLPESRQTLTPDLLLFLFLMAVLANVAYCAAYPVDIFAQASDLREEWLRYRGILLAIGIAFAAVLTHFFASGMFVHLSD
jgi:hypothetical protein